MSILTYNGIVLPYANTTKFEQTPVYDELGQTDWYCTKFDITVQAILNKNHLRVLATTLFNEGKRAFNAAEVMRMVRVQLLKPRQALSFTFNGIDLIPDRTGGEGTVDVKNGPMPQSCNIMRLNEETYLIEYKIIAHYWENNDFRDTTPIVINRPGHNVLYNRWTETIDIDNCMYTKRIREGRYQIRSDNVDGLTADQLRSQMAVVGVPDGFLRESSSYSITPDGLGITYRIVDKEVFKMPPENVHEASGKYIESSTHNGAKRFGEVQLRLKGAKSYPQYRLVEKAYDICGRKLAINGAAITGDILGNESSSNRITISQLLYCEMAVDLYENIVECRMKAMLQATKPRIKGIYQDPRKGFTRNMTFTPQSDEVITAAYTSDTTSYSYRTARSRTNPPPYLDRGSAGFLLVAAAYYDPSLTDTNLGADRLNVYNDKAVTDNALAASQLSRGSEIGTAAKEPE